MYAKMIISKEKTLTKWKRFFSNGSSVETFFGSTFFLVMEITNNLGRCPFLQFHAKN